MNDVGFMQVLNSFDQLINNVTIVEIFEDFLSNSIVEICFHELKDQVQIFIILGSNNSVQFYNIFTINLVKKDDFAIGTLSVSGVLKGIEYIFYSKEFTCFNLINFPDMSVGTTVKFLK